MTTMPPNDLLILKPNVGGVNIHGVVSLQIILAETSSGCEWSLKLWAELECSSNLSPLCPLHATGVMLQNKGK